MGPLRPPHATRNRRVHHPRPPATGSAPHRRSAARAAPPSLRQREQRPLQVRPPQRTRPPEQLLQAPRSRWTGPPQWLLLIPLPQRIGPLTPAAGRRRTARRPRPASPTAGQMGRHLAVLHRPRHRPPAPRPVQMDPTPAEWSDQRPRPWLPPALRMAHRLAVGSRRWNRPPGPRGGWRGSRDSMSTVQGVRMSRRVAPDGRPWMPGGWTRRWTPSSTGRPARRRFGPGRWARRHPGRVSGQPPTRAVASGPRPPTRRPRDPVDGPRAFPAVGRYAAIRTRRRRRDPGSVPPALRRPKRWRPSWTRRRRDLARRRCHRRGGVRWKVRRSSTRPGQPGGRGRVGVGPSQPPTGPW
jgi:hypothetical protein